MIKYTFLVLSCLCLFNVAVYAGQPGQRSDVENHKEEAGLGIGALIGGLIAGPPGAIIGAAGGAWYGNREKKEDLAMARLEQDLAIKKAELVAMQDEFGRLQEVFGQNMQTVKLEAGFDSLQALSNGVSLSIYFRTDSAEIDPEIVPRIRKLGNFIQGYPAIQVHLAAHADRRGTEDYNRKLSEERASTIRQYLLNSGINEERIHPYAYGEKEALSAIGDHEGYVFDRRVDIQLSLDTQI